MKSDWACQNPRVRHRLRFQNHKFFGTTRPIPSNYLSPPLVLRCSSGWIGAPRQSLELLTSFGDGGRQPGEFYGVHSIATDSKGNIYTTETYRGQRVQKFVYKGLGPVTKKDQGVVWPKK